MISPLFERTPDRIWYETKNLLMTASTYLIGSKQLTNRTTIALSCPWHRSLIPLHLRRSLPREVLIFIVFIVLEQHETYIKQINKNSLLHFRLSLILKIKWNSPQNRVYKTFYEVKLSYSKLDYIINVR